MCRRRATIFSAWHIMRCITKAGIRLASKAGARPRIARPEHDYAAALQELSRRQGIEVAITLEDLHDYLDMAAWQPPRDTLVKLSRHNAWLRSLVGRTAK